MTNFTAWGNEVILIALVLGAAFLWFKNTHNKDIGAPGAAVAAAFGALLFALVVIMFWVLDTSPTLSVAGLLPVNDAYSYFSCAYKLLGGEPMSGMCLRRPVYGLMLASMIGLGGLDLQAGILLQALLVGAVASMLAIAIARRWGLASGVLAFSVLFAFYTMVGSATMTAQAGLFWGFIAAIFFLRWAQGERLIDGFMALLFLTVALNARAGAFLILPALIVWAAVPFSEWRHRAPRAGVLILGVVSGFLLNSIILQLYGGEAGGQHSNFSLTLYGLAAGGKGWTYFDTQFQGVARPSGMTQADFVYAEAFKLIFSQPHLLAWAYIKGFGKFLQNLFVFTDIKVARALFGVLWAVGVVTVFRHWRRPVEGALAVAMVGIFLSAPIIAYDGGVRVFAATLAFDAFMVVIGARVIGRRFWGQPPETTEVQQATLAPAFVVTGAAIAFTALLFVLPAVLAPVAGLTAMPAQATCPDGSKVWVAHAGRESPVVGFVGDDEGGMWPPAVNADLMKSRMDRFLHVKEGLQAIEPGNVLIWLYQRGPENTGKRARAVFEGKVEDVYGETIYLCVGEKIPGKGHDIKRARLLRIEINNSE